MASTEGSPTEAGDGDGSGLTFAQDHVARTATDPMNFGVVAGLSVDDVNGGAAPGAGASGVDGGASAMLGGTPGVQQVIINGTPGAWSPSQSLFYSSDVNASGYPLEVQNGGQANIYVNGHVDPTTGNFVPGAPSGASLPPEDVDMARARLGYLSDNYDTPGGITGAWHDVKSWFGGGSPLLSADQIGEKASIGSILASTAVDSSVVYDEFGLQTMQGAGPIWNHFVNPIARGVAAVPAGTAEFKHGVQTELADEAAEAAHRGDEDAISLIAMKQVFIDMALPGSPQDIALMVGGGVVGGKLSGASASWLTRAASESSGFKFLTTDLGDLTSNSLADATAKMAQAFNPTRTASDMSFQQTEALRDLTTAAYEQFKSVNSNAQIGPAFTVAQDVVTGEVRFGINDKMGLVPDELAPVLDERLLNMPPEVQASYIRTANAGSHSEIFAVNDLLLARPGATLDQIAVSTIETGSPAWARGMYKPACPHCEFLLDGVRYVK